MRRHLHTLLRSVEKKTHAPDTAGFPDALQVGDRVGPDHTITGHLGAGGFGYTYTAMRADGEPVALKECYPMEFCRRNGATVGLRAQDEQEAFDAIKTRFEEEARILCSLDHPNVVRGGPLIRANATAYIEMEIVEGELLGSYVYRWFRGLTLKELSAIATQMLHALGHVHDRGYIHKDISPDNIIITADGTAKLIDFGSATPIQEPQTQDPMLIVKAGYSPQEFYRADAKVDKASDLYQLGATLRHCITGRRPVESITRLMAKARGQSDPLPPMPQLKTSGQQKVLDPIDHAMAILLADRMQTAAQWRGDAAR